jgi:hypothetical protein
MMACAAACQCRREIGDGGGSRRSAVDRQRFEDDAGRERQHLSASMPSFGGPARRRSARGLPARLAGAGIGDAGVDHQRADVAAAPGARGRPAPARRTKRFWVNTPATRLPGSQFSSVRSRRFSLADAGFGDAEADAGNGKEASGAGS